MVRCNSSKRPPNRQLKRHEKKMNVQEYLQAAYKTDWLPSTDLKQDINPRLGLAGEIGLLLSALKKEVRDNRPTADATRITIMDELGDILWYSVTVARRAGLNFQRDVLLANLIRIQSQTADSNDTPAPIRRSILESGGGFEIELSRGFDAVNSFGHYQQLAFSTSWLTTKDALVPYLVRIWSNAGQLLAPFGSTRRLDKEQVNHPDLVSRALGDIMWYVAAFASVYDLDLDDIARANLSKINSAFPDKEQMIPTPLYDEDFNDLEKFPRMFNVDFVQSNSSTAVMLINGVRVGDPLTDNAYTTNKGDRHIIDGYRFHDSIHLAFVAVLGWSPVVRKLMMCKRKSDPEIDEVEDGARARIVEEMIVKIVHSHAIGIHREKLLDENKRVNLNLLKDIVVLAEGLEVAGGRAEYAPCKYWEWEKAILEGFRIYNKLRQNGRGRVAVDLQQRCVKFKELPEGKGTRMLIETS